MPFPLFYPGNLRQDLPEPPEYFVLAKRIVSACRYIVETAELSNKNRQKNAVCGGSYSAAKN
jgi:hypothetical protein